jgi:hypothetical protein
MPTWNYEEVKKMNEKLKINFNTLEERWEKYRGIARVLFAKDSEIEQYETDKINTAIAKIKYEAHFENLDTANATKDVRHSL